MVEVDFVAVSCNQDLLIRSCEEFAFGQLDHFPCPNLIAFGEGEAFFSNSEFLVVHDRGGWLGGSDSDQSGGDGKHGG